MKNWPESIHVWLSYQKRIFQTSFKYFTWPFASYFKIRQTPGYQTYSDHKLQKGISLAFFSIWKPDLWRTGSSIHCRCIMGQPTPSTWPPESHPQAISQVENFFFFSFLSVTYLKAQGLDFKEMMVLSKWVQLPLSPSTAAQQRPTSPLPFGSLCTQARRTLTLQLHLQRALQRVHLSLTEWHGVDDAFTLQARETKLRETATMPTLLQSVARILHVLSSSSFSWPRSSI